MQVQREKLVPKMKEVSFWERIHSNIHLFRQRVMDEIEPYKDDFNKEQKLDYLFDHLDKNSNS